MSVPCGWPSARHILPYDADHGLPRQVLRLRADQALPPDSPDRLASALVDAQVDLNPHQVDAALFAFQSPLSQGVLLADEVGLGKTIEAGLVLSQQWAERKRRILVITPANLRKQWHQELTEKFFLPCRILESEVLQRRHQAGQLPQPFEADDDRHLLLPVRAEQGGRRRGDAAGISSSSTKRTGCGTSTSRPTSSPTRSSRRSSGRHKLLLTATPLQNSLLELFGLVSVIDEHVFGDLESFREQFANLHARSRSSRRSRRGSRRSAIARCAGR